jgi:hypothetical protein
LIWVKSPIPGTEDNKACLFSSRVFPMAEIIPTPVMATPLWWTLF